MSLKQWFILMIAFLVIALMLLLGDFLFAGLLSFIVLLFEASVAGIVFKWVVMGLFFIELPILLLYLYKSLKDERKDM